MSVEAQLGEELSGTLITPAAETFEATAAIFNQAFQHRPRFIARCANTQDVSLTIRRAREAGLPITVRSGGHSHGGASVGAGAAVIDLRGLDSITIDRAAMTADVGGGVAAGALLNRLVPEGLVTVTGFDARVGVSGLLLGGGYGLLSRRFGLACDQLVEAEVVLADGRVVIASADREPELWWALKGAGANFGVVTRMRLRLQELPTIYGGVIAYHAGRADELLPRYRALLSTLTDATTVYVGVSMEPAGTISSLSFIAFHVGPLEEGERILSPLAQWGRQLGGEFDEVDVLSLHEPTDETFPEGHRHSWRAHFLEHLEPRTIEVLSKAFDEGRARPSWTVLEHMGGAIGTVDSSASAFPHRRAQVGFVSALKWKGQPDQESLDWQERLYASLSPGALGGYVNYVSPKHGPAAILAAYGANLPRLQQLKRRYDPDWVFQGNVLIPMPSSQAPG